MFVSLSFHSHGSMSEAPVECTWLNPRTTEHYNYARDPNFMTEEHVANVSSAGMPSAADIAKNNGVPPIAIPYMALQNLSRPDNAGKRVIVPMVVGFESTFLANSLQGLLCLPGCESVFMGEPVSTDTAATAVVQKDEDGMNGIEEEAGGTSVDESSAPTLHTVSSPPPPPPPPVPSSNEVARSHASGSSSPRSLSSGGYDINSLGPSGELDTMTAEEAGDNSTAAATTAVGRVDAGGFVHTGHGDGGVGGSNGDRRAARVLRGGIRCHGCARVKTAVSRAYADFVLQHLDDGEIQLKTPAPRSTSADVVTDRQLDDAGELETLRGQTPNVPRCLAPVALPEERRDTTAVLRGEAAAAASTESAGGLSSSPLSLRHATATNAPATHHTHDSTNSNRTNNNNTVSMVATLHSTEKLMLTTSEHSCSDNSPTPSSDEDAYGLAAGHSSEERDRDAEEGEGGQAADSSHHASAAAHALAGETRVGLRVGAQDGRRYTCFASNSVENMPEYHFPRLESDDLIELTAFMVVRSSVQPDEAVDLDLASHILGDPQSVARLPLEVRNALINRAARLMEAAVFLQI